MTSAPTRERILALDVLRGVAVAGILFANVLVFFGLFIMPPGRAAALPTAGRDGVALFLEKVLVDGKFYSVFSLLFGIGFGLQLARGDDAAVPRFKRRQRLVAFTLPLRARRVDLAPADLRPAVDAAEIILIEGIRGPRQFR